MNPNLTTFTHALSKNQITHLQICNHLPLTLNQTWKVPQLGHHKIAKALVSKQVQIQIYLKLLLKCITNPVQMNPTFKLTHHSIPVINNFMSPTQTSINLLNLRLTIFRADRFVENWHLAAEQHDDNLTWKYYKKHYNTWLFKFWTVPFLDISNFRHFFVWNLNSEKHKWNVQFRF